jgi:hypothetical protein
LESGEFGSEFAADGAGGAEEGDDGGFAAEGDGFAGEVFEGEVGDEAADEVLAAFEESDNLDLLEGE